MGEPEFETKLMYAQRSFSIAGSSSDDHLVRLIADTGTFYEVDLLSYIEAIKDVLPGGLSVDVGANIGNHAIFLATFVRSPVIAFEPNPEVLPLLQHNLAVNGVASRIVEKALGASAGHGSVVLPDGLNVGTAQIRTGDGDIEVTTLDEVCAGEQVAVMKVDVEGMELAVLQGATLTIKRCRPHLFLEAATPKHFDELKDFLRPLGYRPIVRWAYTPVWHFAPNPSLALIMRARRLRLSYKAKQLLKRI